LKPYIGKLYRIGGPIGKWPPGTLVRVRELQNGLFKNKEIGWIEAVDSTDCGNYLNEQSWYLTDPHLFIPEPE
jgi:hypothetical protein